MEKSNSNFKNPNLKIIPANRLNYYVGLLVMFLILGSCSTEPLENETLNETTQKELLLKKSIETWQDQVAAMKKAMTRYRDFNYAQANGYFVQAGPYVPHMGYHFLNPALVDGTFDYLKPEIILFYPDDGEMKFGGVEYLLPVADFDNPGDAPEGFIGDEDHWHLNQNAGGWTLHVWIGKKNPNGIFAGFNPKVPASSN